MNGAKTLTHLLFPLFIGFIIGGAISGCGPAFVDLMIEGFADAAVRYGIPRDKALAMVSATVKGSARLQLETGMHPGVIKDAVCSPAGTTIRGVEALEAHGMRHAFIAAVNAAAGDSGQGPVAAALK